jgi:Dolichyl-phosphate-mannose-protein mannosyltransferase
VNCFLRDKRLTFGSRSKIPEISIMLQLKVRQLKVSTFLLLIPIALSAFTHLWNPIGFPSIHIDEGAYYLDRAFSVLNGLGPQKEGAPYDHPYFGWFFLAGIFKIIGYPESLNPQPGSANSVGMIYTVPRIVMGFLAVLDTFLIYKISERHYNRNVAFIAALLFAVMPFSWMIRRILLESVQLPFILSSILFCLYAANSKNTYNKSILLTFISGTLLGIAIFTKIPAVTMIPLLGFIILKNSSKVIDKKTRLQKLGSFLLPVIAIPLIWPVYALSIGEMDRWVEGIIWQTNRIGTSLVGALWNFYVIDPVLFILGIAGLLYVLAIKRDVFLFLFSIPFMIFLYLIEFVSVWHLVPLLPSFTIAAAIIISDLLNIITSRRFKRQVGLIVISGIGIFGLVSTTMIITTNLNPFHFKAVAFASKIITDLNNNDSTTEDKLTVIGSHRYFWMILHLFDKEHRHDYKNIFSKSNITTEKVLFIADTGLVSRVTAADGGGFEQIKKKYKDTQIVAAFGENQILYDETSYPYTSMKYNALPGRIDIRTDIAK